MRLTIPVCAILVISAILAQPSNSAQTPVAMTIEGPTAMMPGEAGFFFVNISGGPVETNATYKIRYWMESSDTSGASPVQSSPGEQSGNKTTFKVNASAIDHEGSMDFIVEGIAGNETMNTTVRKMMTVQVLATLTLTASFANDGDAAVVNVTVRFFVDENYVGNKTIGRINPGDRGTASIRWMPVGTTYGQHVIRVEADIDGNGIIDSLKGEIVAYDIFYKTGGDIAPGYLVILAVVISFLGIIALIAYRRRLRMR